MENSLAKKNEELCKEWSVRNLPLVPENISYGSNKKVWWNGSCGHEWEASVKSRSSGEGCPICSGKRVVKGINDLATTNPKLVKQWSKKNKNLLPTMVTAGSHKKIMWRGKCSHEWTASVRNRVNGSGCPYCSHHMILEGFNDFASQFPTMLVEWSDRNKRLKPQEVTAFSNKKVWWKCDKGHEWEARISDRAYGSGCPYCAGHVIAKGINDLETRQPELAKEWSERNLQLRPDMVSEKSRQNVWWKCSHCGYEWKSVIWSRVKGAACPVCADKMVQVGINDLTTTDRDLLQDWDYEQNGGVTPTMVSRKSMRSVWWKCCYGHRWKARIAERVFDRKGCSVCEDEYAMVFPQLAAAYYARKIGQKVVFNSDEEIGLTLNAYFPEERLAFIWERKGMDYESVKEYLCETRGIKLIRFNPKMKTREIITEIKKAFQSVHVFIVSNVEDDELYIRSQFEAWRKKNR